MTTTQTQHAEAVRIHVHYPAGEGRLATTGADRDFDAFPFLPPGYRENTCHRYPVLYMHDGHNLFNRNESAVGKEWDVQDSLDQLDRMTSIEQVIVVGVYPRDRMNDYLRAGGEAYRQFLAETLVPHIDGQNRTLVGPRYSEVVGFSLGGVAALECAWSHPERFGMAGCLSATFGFDDDLRARVLTEPRPDIRVYLDSGWPRDNFEVTRDMRARLVRAGFVEGVEVLYFAFHPAGSASLGPPVGADEADSICTSTSPHGRLRP